MKKKVSHTKNTKSGSNYKSELENQMPDALDLEPGSSPPNELRHARAITQTIAITKYFFTSFFWLIIIIITSCTVYISLFNKKYDGKILPNVTISGIPFEGKTEKQAREWWDKRNTMFTKRLYEFQYDDVIATASGDELGLGFDSELSARQAYLVGRSGNIASDLIMKFFQSGSSISPIFRYDQNALDDLLNPLADALAIPVADALFEFKDGKVTVFKPSGDGREVDIGQTKNNFIEMLKNSSNLNEPVIRFPLVVKTVKPTVATDQANDFGIRELIGRGYSEYQGSIPGRRHNVALATSKIHGVLIKPGDVLSFNDTLGDVSASTGFQPAYIIKNGRTVLGDGGGVCQVSSTFFRAALAAGLPIIERQAHAYRVHYYEEGGYKAGLDATVFAPTTDLKIQNDTPGYILVQTKIDETIPSLTFELYGTKDGRKSEILDHKVWGISAPPPPLYQDDPTLMAGVTKQVDFSAWGAKASFQYKVTKEDGTILQDQIFYSNFRPWQAVFLKGTKTQ